jgi:hypothetical protein
MKKGFAVNVLLAGVAAALSLLAVAAVSRTASSLMGLRDPLFRYENKLDLWVADDEAGFVNKPNFSGFAFGTIPITTNERGFRGTRATANTGTATAPRLNGVGDSVMWGTGTTQEDSVLGMLEGKLAKDSPHEVINAGVVGYSTYQELVLLEKRVLPLRPAVVLVNYCVNDILPTEDPFDNERRIYVDYLRQLVKARGAEFTVEELSRLHELADIIANADNVWDTVSELEQQSQQWLDLLRRVFVELPAVRMARLSRDAGVLLVYVFIPPAMNRKAYAYAADNLKRVLAAAARNPSTSRTRWHPTAASFPRGDAPIVSR